MPKVRPNKLKTKPRVLTPEQIERRRRWNRRIIHGVGMLAVLGGFTIGYTALAGHVRQNYALVHEPPALVLINRPAWMSDAIATDIAARLAETLPPSGSTLDRQPLERLNQVLTEDAWVRQVNSLRRDRSTGRDTILIDCQFRTPLAIARVEGGRQAQFQLVCAEGVLLPIRYEFTQVEEILQGREATNLRVITGLGRDAPTRTGQPWDSPRMKAGLEMAALLLDVPAAAEVTLIDVSSLGRPDQPQIVLRTRQNTEIRWGQPPGASDLLAEAPVQTKLRHLQHVHDSFRGNYPAWVDVRFDAVRYLKPR